MAETELTKEIKKATHTYAPKMNASMRTIRYADEVWTPHGIVDSIRFEDYIVSREERCRRIHFDQMDEQQKAFWMNGPAFVPGQCKIPDETFPNKNCKGCVYRISGIPVIGMMVTAYEVKITKSDFLSVYGHSIDDARGPIANENYYCMPKDLVPAVKDLVPEHCGILAYYGNGLLRKIKPSAWLEIDDKTKILLLYNAMKKWCDHVMR